MRWQPAPRRASRRGRSSPGPAVHDFDFYMGTWRVHHRRLQAAPGRQRRVGGVRGDVARLAAPRWRRQRRRQRPRAARRDLSGDLAPVVRPGDGPVVDLVARRPHPRPSRSAGRRRLRGRRSGRSSARTRSRAARSSSASCWSGITATDVPLGAGVLAGRRGDLGGQLGHGVDADAARDEAARPDGVEPRRGSAWRGPRPGYGQ